MSSSDPSRWSLLPKKKGESDRTHRRRLSRRMKQVYEKLFDRQRTEALAFMREHDVQTKSVERGKARVRYVPRWYQEELHLVMKVNCWDKGKAAFVIIDKPRQLGFSTHICQEVNEGIQRHPGMNSLTVAHDADSTRELFRKVHFAKDQFPDEVRPTEENSSGYLISLRHYTRPDDPDYYLTSTAQVMTARRKTGARSATIHRMHLSEVAHWETYEGLLGFKNSVPDEPYCFCIYESTAKGKSGPYYETWRDAMAGKNEFIPFFVAWYEFDEYQLPFATPEEREEFIESLGHYDVERYGGQEELALFKGEVGYSLPSRWKYPLRGNVRGYKPLTPEQLKWRRWAIDNKCDGYLDSFHQEYPATPEESFVSSGRPVFDLAKLERLKPYAEKVEDASPLVSLRWRRMKGADPEMGYEGMEALIVPDRRGLWRLFRPPEIGMRCAFGFDVAEGLQTLAYGGEGDRSSGYVGDALTGEPFMRINAHLPVEAYEQEIFKASRAFGDAIGHVEANNHGLAVIKLLERDGFTRLLRRPRPEPTAEGKRADEARPGFYTSAKSKPRIIQHLAKVLRECHIPSDLQPWCPFDIELIRQMESFIRTPHGKYEASPGHKDDLVMGRALFEEARETTPFDLLSEVPPSFAEVELFMGIFKNVDYERYDPDAQLSAQEWFDD